MTIWNKSWGKRAARVVAVIAASVLACLILSNAFIRYHRTLYIVNGTAATLQCEISDLGRIKIPPGVTPVTLNEGHYVAKIDKPFRDEAAFDVRAKYFDRWSDKPVWVLNPGGAAIILCHRIVYTKDAQPGSFTCEYGRTFAFFPAVDFPFSPPPSQVQLQSGEHNKVQYALEFSQGDPVDIFGALANSRRMDEACQFAEWRLAAHPDDQQMLAAYVAANEGVARASSFLQNGLAARPVRIEWHRAYQNVSLRKNRQRLIGEYDRMLSAEPTNSALLYLRGRLCESFTEGQDYFTRSLQADRDNPYPAFALAFDATSVADWASAKRLLDHAIALQPGNFEFLTLWTVACIGLNEPGPVEAVWRRILQEDPLNFQAELSLCQALIVDHKEAEARAAASDYHRGVLARYREAGRPVAESMDSQLLYLLGDFAGMEKMSRQDASPPGRSRSFVAMIEQNQPEQAAHIISLTDGNDKDPFELLVMSLAWRIAGNSGEADKWQDRATALFRSSGNRDRVADLLSGRLEPTAQIVDNLALTASSKAVLLASLALTHPDHRSELATAARRLNVERVFPHYLVQRATDSAH